MKNKPFKEGDRIVHYTENITGTIISIDYDSYPWHKYGRTTCSIDWDDGAKGDIQWTNKICKLGED